MRKLLLVLIFTCLTTTFFAQAEKNYLNNPIYKRQLEFYELYKPKNVKIIMLGNSLTHGVDWSQLLGRNDVIGMGIVSDIISGYYNRINYVNKLNPKVCFVLGGLNDIYQWVPVETIFEDYKKVIEALKRNGTTPVIQSTLYAGINWGEAWLEENNPDVSAAEVNKERNSQVDRLNTMLKNYARENNFEYIDLNSLMSRNKYLRPELTYDGAHLNAAGYKIWGREVEEVLKKLGL
ncbi:MAG: GDSL-type esterase/lipase family protein [Melioribacteraceae bacterium]|nr:GDSL-type esterase/lipase family protein [Melioribacteraceae bacterium]